MNTLSRRELLKLAGLVPASYLVGNALQQISNDDLPNIIVLVFDSWSASNTSVYGYPRQTTPFLENLTQNALVYNQHYTGGNFTPPGTATLLTGAYPWFHRVLSPRTTIPFFNERNLFSNLPNHHKIAYTHNPLADNLLRQFGSNLQEYQIPASLYLDYSWVDRLLANDAEMAFFSQDEILNLADGNANSLLYAKFSRFINSILDKRNDQKYNELYPYGLPKVTSGDESGKRFLLEEGIDWMLGAIDDMPKPFLGYFHFLPPHHPYTPSIHHAFHFSEDNYSAAEKPLNPFSDGTPEVELAASRAAYDGFIHHIDVEINRAMKHLEENSYLENTWVFLTSDHGELFERGTRGHFTPQLYDPISRIPLMVWGPGITGRTEVNTPTSATDLLPTISQLAGEEMPNWTEGHPLPHINNAPEHRHPAFSFESKQSDPTGPIDGGVTMVMAKENFKLIKYANYKELGGETRYELYDLEDDPQELDDLYPQQPAALASLLDELETKHGEISIPVDKMMQNFFEGK